MKFEDYLNTESLNEGTEYYLLIKSRYSTLFKHTMKQYLVWTKADLQKYEPKAYGATMDAAIATFNKVREDREEEEYIESLGAIESNKRYASKETDTLNKAKADIMKISPEAKAALSAVSGSLKEAKKVYYLLLKRRTNDQLGKSFYKFMVWTLADLKSYSNRAKGASMERAVNAYNNSANAYLEVIGEVSGITEPAESGDKTDIAAAKSEIISQCPAVKNMVQNVRESLVEGEFISVKDLESRAKKYDPAKEAKLKAALAKVDAARAKVEKFMKTYDSSDEKQRLERVKLGCELAAAMNAYLELV